ncbi:MAG: CocE/NonD family hydrolase [Snowella sp.]|nr:CocE/NonD family hydrolase [Snowella sp.]
MFDVHQETAFFMTQDGFRLDADLYYPNSSDPLPVLLMRQPYGRKIASTVVYAHPAWYASQGYLVVIQDVRGRGTSEGRFSLFEHEIKDGLETVNWVANLPQSNGKVGMYGFSYQGMTQLYAAARQPEALKTICPAMIAYNLYQDWAYENGAFCLQMNLGWAIQLAAETAKLNGDREAFQKLYAASRHLPLSDPIPPNPQILQEFAPDSFYHDWLKYPEDHDYWKQRSPQYLLKNVDLPMLHIGGWFDPHLRGNWKLYHHMKTQSQFPQHLIVGPWGHLPWGRKTGEINYGEAASSFIDEYQIAWFDYWLKGKESKILPEKPIKLFEMGSNQWQSLDNLESHQSQVFYLTSNGLANIQENAGRLVTQLSEEHSKKVDYIVHDPWRPVPSLGGHAGFPAGSFERSHLESRFDILTYTSEPLTENLHLLGQIQVEVQTQADTPSFDLCATVSEVYPDGRIYHFSQGYIRLNATNSEQSEQIVTFSLQPTCIKIVPGNAIRLSLSGACFPAYTVNSGTDQLLSETPLMDYQIITLSVQSGGLGLSKISLPLRNF